jgi:hypothetical protein
MERALTYLSERDQRKIRKAFESRAGDPEQAQHLFREVMAGSFLARQGFTVQYEPKINEFGWGLTRREKLGQRIWTRSSRRSDKRRQVLSATRI